MNKNMFKQDLKVPNRHYYNWNSTDVPHENANQYKFLEQTKFLLLAAHKIY